MYRATSLAGGLSLSVMLAVAAVPAGAADKKDRAREAIAAAQAKIEAANKVGASGEVPRIQAAAAAALRAAREDLATGHKEAAIQDANHASELADTAIGMAQRAQQDHAADAASAAHADAAAANARADRAERAATEAAAAADAARNAPPPPPVILAAPPPPPPAPTTTTVTTETVRRTAAVAPVHAVRHTVVRHPVVHRTVRHRVVHPARVHTVSTRTTTIVTTQPQPQ